MEATESGGMTSQARPMPHPTTAWDNYDAYLFDVDGTLLHCEDAVHYFAFCAALTELAGRPVNLDGVVAHGNTDIGIVRDALCLAGVPESSWRSRLPDLREWMADFVEERRTQICARALPGAAAVLQHLAARGALVGVATGNLERIGKLKLSSCGLLDHFAFGGYSDAFEYRRDVVAAALEQARARRPGARVCLVGDTPQDVQAARHNGVDVIAVATGIYSFEELASTSPDCCVNSLEELLDESAG